MIMIIGLGLAPSAVSQIGLSGESLDLKGILTENSKALQGASIADKVIGKTAAAILAVSGVKEIYADVISSFAIIVLKENNIKYEYSKKVKFIKNKDNTGMCPMENRFKDEKDINNIYNEIFN